MTYPRTLNLVIVSFEKSDRFMYFRYTRNKKYMKVKKGRLKKHEKTEIMHGGARKVLLPPVKVALTS